MRAWLLALCLTTCAFAATPQKESARATTYLGFGPAVFSSMNTSNAAYQFSGAAGWEVGPIALVKLAGDITVGSGALFTTAALGVQAFPLEGDTTPYGEASFGYAYTKTGGEGLFSGEGTGGFFAGLGAGAVFFRKYSVNLDLGVRAGFLLARNALGHPNFFAFRVGLWF